MTTAIERSIDEFDAIANWARGEESRIGYFAALYRGVTRSMIGPVMAPAGGASPRIGELGGFFDDFKRADAFVEVFAGRYFKAFQDRHKLDPDHPWAVHFANCEDPKSTILQILTSGANAHMNLDLTMAAIEIGAGDLPSLKRDFDLINEVLSYQIAACQQQVLDVSPLMKLVNIAPRLTAKMVGFVIERARSFAWDNALRISTGLNGPLPDADTEAELTDQVGDLGKRIVRPPFLVRLPLRFAARFEPDSARVVIDKLLDAEPDTVELRAALEAV